MPVLDYDSHLISDFQIQISLSQFNDSLSYHISNVYGDGQDEDASESSLVVHWHERHSSAV